jgi:hypothetical protein
MEACVDFRVRRGHHVRRKVRACSSAAAYEKVLREHVESCGPPGMELAIVTRRGLRRRATVVTGARPDDPDDGGLAGVREPRRPMPGPSHLRAARETE